MENIPENIKTIINSCYPYIEDFNPAQKAVIESGYLENNKNCVIAIPTASGKTVLGIMAALKSILDGGKAVYDQKQTVSNVGEGYLGLVLVVLARVLKIFVKGVHKGNLNRLVGRTAMLKKT